MEGKRKTRRFIHFRRGTVQTGISPNTADLKRGPLGGVAILSFPDPRPHITPSSPVLRSPPVGRTEANALLICRFRGGKDGDGRDQSAVTPLRRWTAGGTVGQVRTPSRVPTDVLKNRENCEKVLNAGVVKPKKNLIYWKYCRNILFVYLKATN